MKKVTVTICRGIPGSGKSTWARAQAETVEPAHLSDNAGVALHPEAVAVIVSADDWFVRLQPDGTLGYRFDGREIAQAHDACLRRFVAAILAAEPHVIVDNTNTTAAEMIPYVAVALAHGCEVVVRTFRVDAATAAARNVHGVPLAACEAMAKRLADTVPPYFWGGRVRYAEGDGQPSSQFAP
jgi:predicted kinase